MDWKAKVAIIGILIKDFVKEPYEKAMVNWTPPPWLIEAAGLLAVAIIVFILIPKKEPKP